MKSYVLEIPGKVHNYNEDSHYISHFQIDDKPAGIFIIADGCSGHNGTNASHYAVKTIGFNLEETLVGIKKRSSEPNYPPKLLLDIVDKTNNELHNQSVGKTTLDVLLVIDNTYHFAHLGDSQIYALEGESLRCLTVDESAHGEPTNYLGRKLIGEKTLTERLTINSSAHLPSAFLLATDGLTSRVAQTEIKTILDKYKYDDPALILTALGDIIKYPLEKIKTLSLNLLQEIVQNNPCWESNSPYFRESIIAGYKSMCYQDLNNKIDNLLKFDDTTLIYIDLIDQFSLLKEQNGGLSQRLAEISQKYEESKTQIKQITGENRAYQHELDMVQDHLSSINMVAEDDLKQYGVINKP